MTLLFSFPDDSETPRPTGGFKESPRPGPEIREKTGSLLIAEKLEVPENRVYFRRDRLEKLLDKLLERFGTALVLGRAGTGKTALAADYSRKFERISWLSVESSDVEWDVFARYFSAALADRDGPGPVRSLVPPVIGLDPDLVSAYVETVLRTRKRLPEAAKHLIVLDKTHNIFDAPWFEDFLLGLIFNLGRSSRLLILSRTQPPLPIWRLRSKQSLGFLGEKLLEFSAEETRKLFEYHGLNVTAARYAQRRSFGRISKLMEMIEAVRSGSNRQGS
ncbi:MAG TPA: hypothetical protein VMM38_10720 [Aridibacter sp.]|nr:hypothetical protein [Aridibacter sp.]